MFAIHPFATTYACSGSRSLILGLVRAMISLERFRDAHLPHRRSILEEFIANRHKAPRDAFNCYIDSALITCRSLCGLLGFEVYSKSVTDMGDPTQPQVKFKKFAAIRANVDSRVVINNVKDEKELKQIANWEEIILSLNAANRCIAHFDEISDLEHRADPATVETAAKAILRELDLRVKA